MNKIKTCRVCKKTRPIEQFNQLRKSGDGFDSRCKICYRAYRKQHRLLYPERIKEERKAQHIHRHHGEGRFVRALRNAQNKAKDQGYEILTITTEEIKKALTGYCDICRTVETEHDQHLQLNFCRKTGNFRGWLCKSCNHVLTSVGDSADELLAMAAYIKRHE